MDFMRGPDDDRLASMMYARLRADYDKQAAARKGECRVCRAVDTWIIGDLCGICLENRRWSDDNRAMCQMIHRGGA